MTNAVETFSKNGESAVRVVAGESTLAPIRGRVGELGSIVTLNEVGAEIWRLINGARSSDDIAQAMCDVRSFLKRLRDRFGRRYAQSRPAQVRQSAGAPECQP